MTTPLAFVSYGALVLWLALVARTLWEWWT